MLIMVNNEYAHTHELGEMRDERVAMRDGVRLMTHVWLPQGEGPWPVIVQRNPYVNADNVRDPGLMIFVRYGFAVVHQECRGRNESEGTWEPFVHEREDGLDTLVWITAQSWQDGSIGLYGPSYMSFNQWVLADALPAEVKTLYLSVLGTDQHRFMYMNGMFRPDIYTGWAVTNAGVDWQGRDTNEVANEAFQFVPQAEMDKQMLGRTLGWYQDFLANPGAGDPLWQTGLWHELKQAPGRLNVPVHLTGGWFDIALDTMFEAYGQLRPEIREASRMVIGPWSHAMEPYGDLTYPNGWADGPNGGLKAALDWFNTMLKGAPYPNERGVIRSYTIGANQWGNWRSWPPRHATKPLYLHGNNELGSTPGQQPSAVSYTYDPANPVQTAGGSGMLSVYGDSPCLPKAASVRQPEPGSRPDVITFLSAPVEEDLLIAGQIKIVLFVDSTAEDTAFTAKISELFPDGKAYNIADGITSLAYRNGSPKTIAYEPGETIELVIECWPMIWKLRRGSRIRLDVSSSNFPAYHVHQNAAGNWAQQGQGIAAVQTIHWGGALPSRIELPLASESQFEC
ncbi:CocE/NonD family hydrolase [Paenibacillaceae bacterium]|nr:CocE/NonD family hydrolase [Paenibacillaceae bacterium]